MGLTAQTMNELLEIVGRMGATHILFDDLWSGSAWSFFPNLNPHVAPFAYDEDLGQWAISLPFSADEWAGKTEAHWPIHLALHRWHRWIAAEKKKDRRQEEMQRDRDLLRDHLVERQDNVCVMCGHGMHGDAHVHEAIVKKGDLPNDPRIFVPENCCCLHASCHENTKEVDEACAKYLIHHYGIQHIAGWLIGLQMREYPGRAMVVLALADAQTI